MATQYPLAKFECFSHLPQEIRALIWKLALVPRVTQIRAKLKFFHGSEPGKFERQTCAVPMPHPALFSVSAEARHEALRFYHQFSNNGKTLEKHSPDQTMYNPSMDTIYLDCQRDVPIYSEDFTHFLHTEGLMERWANIPVERTIEHSETLDTFSKTAQASVTTSLAIHIQELNWLHLSRRKPKDICVMLQRFSNLKELIIVCMEEQYCIPAVARALMKHSPEIQSELAGNPSLQFEKLSFIHLEDADPKCASEMAYYYGKGKIANAQAVLDKAVEAGWKMPEMKFRVGRRENGGRNRLLFCTSSAQPYI